MNPVKLFFVIGACNAGKSTFLWQVSQKYKVGLVEVGKILRAKYPPEYFQGQAAPKHTAKEAYELMVSGIKQCVTDGHDKILIDGQPRDSEQCTNIISDYFNRPEQYDCRVIHIWAPLAVRKQRAWNRDHNDPEKLKLSEARLMGDAPALLDVISQLYIYGMTYVHTFDTSNSFYRPMDSFRDVLNWMERDND